MGIQNHEDGDVMSKRLYLHISVLQKNTSRLFWMRLFLFYFLFLTVGGVDLNDDCFYFLYTQRACVQRASLLTK